MLDKVLQGVLISMFLFTATCSGEDYWDMYLNDGRVITGVKIARTEIDSVTVKSGEKLLSMAISDIVVLKQERSAASIGLIALIGAAAGGTIGFASAPSHLPSEEREVHQKIGAFFYGTIGAGVGGIVGSFGSTDVVIKFYEKSHSEKQQILYNVMLGRAWK